MSHRVLISLGSNINPEHHLPLSVMELRRFVNVLKVSTVWQTRAVGDPEQADFLNAAVLVETQLDPSQLKFQVLRAIEDRLGRVRDPHNRNAARPIDLDIAFYDDVVLAMDRIQIPDPDVLTRPFLATPLAELDPDLRHPETGQTLGEIAQRLGIDDKAMFARPDISLEAASVKGAASSSVPPDPSRASRSDDSQASEH